MPMQLILRHVNAERAMSVLKSREADKRAFDSLRNGEPATIGQRHWAVHASHSVAVGGLKYALGFDIEECRHAFVAGLSASIETGRLRGTTEPFPVLDVHFDPTHPSGDPGRVQMKHRHLPGARDFSLGNSKRAYMFTCLGLGIGESAAAREQAGLIWDPPNADYIGARSVVCKPNDQALAYSLKYYLQSDFAAAFEKAISVRSLPKDYIGMQARLLQSILTNDATQFLKVLENLLEKHNYLSRHDSSDASLYICFPALGMSALALHKGLITTNCLPQNAYLPLPLLVPKS